LARGKNDLIPIKEGGAGLARGKNDLSPIPIPILIPILVLEIILIPTRHAFCCVLTLPVVPGELGQARSGEKQPGSAAVIPAFDVLQ
jgi:hypothetical protein